MEITEHRSGRVCAAHQLRGPGAAERRSCGGKEPAVSADSQVVGPESGAARNDHNRQRRRWVIEGIFASAHPIFLVGLGRVCSGAWEQSEDATEDLTMRRRATRP